MTETTFDDAAKQQVMKALTDRLRSDLTALTDTVGSERQAAELGGDGSHSVDDMSQADAYGELYGLLGASVDAEQAVLAAIEKLDLAHTDVVGPGAIVGFDGDRYVVGAPVGSFECDGIGYEGISLGSPIYAEIRGLKVGDSFTYRGHDHTVDFVA